MQNLLRYIHTLTDFSDRSWELLQPALTKATMAKDDFLLKETQVCNALYFIEKGYCKSFFDKDGVQKNTDFYFENEMLTNITSFGSGQKSEYYIQACEDMDVIIFDKQKLFLAAQQAPEIETLGKKCLRITAAKMEEHANLFTLFNPQERYAFLEQNRHDILQRVSLTELSSYLGIARETLSRIRRRRSQ